MDDDRQLAEANEQLHQELEEAFRNRYYSSCPTTEAEEKDWELIAYGMGIKDFYNTLRSK